MKKIIIIILTLIGLLPATFNAQAENIGFVTRQGNQLMLNGQPYYFSSSNNYFLFYEPQTVVDEVFQDASDLGLAVIRTWGSSEEILKNGYCFQPSAYVYDEPTFQKMDYIIWRANQSNIRLIIPLVNNWNHFGGMDKYVEWSPTASTHDDFYTDQWSRDCYKAYVNYFLNRVNTLTNIAYKDDPTIMIWELANEPRCGVEGGMDIFQAWLEEMSTYIKSIDTNHLVSIGSEGWYADDPNAPSVTWKGSDYIRNNSYNNIDICSFHLFSDDYGLTEENTDHFIYSHIYDAHNTVGKPVYLGEFGQKADRQAQPFVGTNVLHDFSIDTEEWFNPDGGFKMPIRVGNPSYNGNGSLEYSTNGSIGPGQEKSEGKGEKWYGEPYPDYSGYGDLSAWVYLPGGSPETLRSDFYLFTGDAWRWFESSDIPLIPGQWNQVYINTKNISDLNLVRAIGIRVFSFDEVYTGNVYYDLVEGVIGNLFDYPTQLANRNDYYNNVYNLMDYYNGNGAGFWMILPDNYTDWDNYGVYYPFDTSTVSVIQDFSNRMKNKTGPSASWYACESVIDWHAVTGYSDASQIILNDEFFTQGEHSLELVYDYDKGEGKAYFENAGPAKVGLNEDWSSKKNLIFDLYNSGDATSANVVVSTGTDEWEWHESYPQELIPGWNRVVADLTASTWKSDSTGWEYTGYVADLNEVMRFSVGIFGYNTDGAVYLDNIRLYEPIPYLAGWPKEAGDSVLSSPAVGDIDGDGGLDLIVGSYDQKVYAWHSDGTLLSGWPQTTNHNVYSSPVLANIDDDNSLEVVIGSLDGYVYAYNGDGSLVDGWPAQTNEQVFASCAIGDVDGDRREEIVAISRDPGTVYIWRGDGTLVNSWTLPNGDWVYASPALANLDNDRALEIVVATFHNTTGKVYVYNSDGTIVNGWPQQTGYSIYSSPAIGDLDNNGSLEIVVGSLDYKIYAWHNDGTLVNGWPQTTESWIYSSPALADLDNDNRLEIAIGSFDKKMYVFNDDGTLLLGWPQATQGPIKSSPAMADINNDGQLDIVVGSRDKFLYAWDKNGNFIDGWPNGNADIVDSSPAIVDLDGDGRIEIAVGSGNSVYVWALYGTCPKKDLPWPMFRHDKKRSGRYGPESGDGIIIYVPEEYPAIQQAIEAALPGYLIYVSAGTYPENIRMKPNVDVIGIDGPDKTFIVGDDTTNVISFDNQSSEDFYGLLQGFTIQGAGDTFSNIYMANKVKATIKNCILVASRNVGITVSDNSSPEIINNTIVGLKGVGVRILNNSSAVIKNNIISGAGIGIFPDDTSQNNLSISYNDIWGEGRRYRNCSAGLGEITKNPLFISLKDYHLQPNSPCIDTGDPQSPPDPDRTPADIGALYFNKSQ